MISAPEIAEEVKAGGERNGEHIDCAEQEACDSYDSYEHSVRQSVFDFFCRNDCVEQECSANLQVTYHIKLEGIGFLRAGNEVCLVDIVWGMNWCRTESQVRTCDPACLL